MNLPKQPKRTTYFPQMKAQLEKALRAVVSYQYTAHLTIFVVATAAASLVTAALLKDTTVTNIQPPSPTKNVLATPSPQESSLASSEPATPTATPISTPVTSPAKVTPKPVASTAPSSASTPTPTSAPTPNPTPSPTPYVPQGNYTSSVCNGGTDQNFIAGHVLTYVFEGQNLEPNGKGYLEIDNHNGEVEFPRQYLTGGGTITIASDGTYTVKTGCGPVTGGYPSFLQLVITW